jgi:uncharacterized OsmC-like protein
VPPLHGRARRGVLFARRAGLPDRPRLVARRCGAAAPSGIAAPSSGGGKASRATLGGANQDADNRGRQRTRMRDMTTQDITTALRRAQTVFERRPDTGLHDDSTATTSWQGGLRFVTRHPSGTTFSTDMPIELGGSGDRITPGWLFRAGIAACAATSIALVAALEGIELSALEVRVASRSDTRGMLGMTEAGGALVDPAPQDMQLQVRIAAAGVAGERLRALVERGYRSSPCPAAVGRALPIDVRIDAVEAIDA